MKKLLLILFLFMLLISMPAAQAYFGLFDGIFGRARKAQQTTERQMGQIIEHAEAIGGGATNFIIGPQCVHYSVSPINLILVEYSGSYITSDLTPAELESMLRQLEPNITADLGNVNPTYREAIIC